MDEMARIFRPLPGETRIHLQQIGDEAAAQVEDEGLLTIELGAGVEAAVVGLLSGALPQVTRLPSLILALATVLVAIFCVTILVMILRGKIDMRLLLSEADGKASLSRTQAFIFTIVLAASVLSIVLRTGTFPADVPWWILAIMAGSLGTYLASKGLQQSGGAPALALAGTPAEGTAPAATGGPLVRIGKGAPFQVDPAQMPADEGVYETLVRVSSDKPERPPLIALAVGEARLRVSSSFTAEDVAGAWIVVSGPGGHEQRPLLGETTLTTPPGEISEVRLLAQATSAKPVMLPVRVEAF